MSLSKKQILLATLVFLILLSALTYSYIEIGIVVIFLLAIPALIAYFIWYSTYLKTPILPSIILPPFMATVAGFEFHLIEEYHGHYAPAISRIFNFAWADNTFVTVVLILTGALCLVSIGLYYKNPIAGFIAIFFVVSRLAEIALFIFPFVKPAIQPKIVNTISQNISGLCVADMPNYYDYTVGHYYFPGMYTVILTLVHAVFSLIIIWKNKNSITAKIKYIKVASDNII